MRLATAPLRHPRTECANQPWLSLALSTKRRPAASVGMGPWLPSRARAAALARLAAFWLLGRRSAELAFCSDLAHLRQFSESISQTVEDGPWLAGRNTALVWRNVSGKPARRRTHDYGRFFRRSGTGKGTCFVQEHPLSGCIWRSSGVKTWVLRQDSHHCPPEAGPGPNDFSISAGRLLVR
jgi:hypothetical protein